MSLNYSRGRGGGVSAHGGPHRFSNAGVAPSGSYLRKEYTYSIENSGKHPLAMMFRYCVAQDQDQLPQHRRAAPHHQRQHLAGTAATRICLTMTMPVNPVVWQLAGQSSSLNSLSSSF